MKRIFISIVAAAAILFAAPSSHAKKPVQTDVEKALKEAYPDAQTQIIGTREINGVKVNQVKVTTKEGESTAEITEFGDFLMYGVPRQDKSLNADLTRWVQGIFKAPPKDVDMYRVTNYYVDFTGPKTYYRARFDAVGRLKDINSNAELQRTGVASMEKASKADAKRAEEQAKKYLPDAQIEGVYKAEGGENFFYVDTKGGGIYVNPQGRVYAFREEIKKEELPKPVLDTVDRMFNANNIAKTYRGEFEYYQFDEIAPSGEQVVVKIRPNGDILEVSNDQAAAEEKAMTASHKEQVGPQPAKAKSKAR